MTVAAAIQRALEVADYNGHTLKKWHKVTDTHFRSSCVDCFDAVHATEQGIRGPVVTDVCPFPRSIGY